jgi:hypothetical protein
VTTIYGTEGYWFESSGVYFLNDNQQSTCDIKLLGPSPRSFFVPPTNPPTNCCFLRAAIRASQALNVVSETRFVTGTSGQLIDR